MKKKQKNKKQTMNFIEAFAAMMDGRIVKSSMLFYKLDDCGGILVATKESKKRDKWIRDLFAWNLFLCDFELYEEQKDILTDKEKAYLEAVLRPFKDKAKHIKRYVSNMMEDREFIALTLDDSYMAFPYFKAGTMYQNMEEEKPYTLKELGLFEGEER